MLSSGLKAEVDSGYMQLEGPACGLRCSSVRLRFETYYLCRGLGDVVVWRARRSPTRNRRSPDSMFRIRVHSMPMIQCLSLRDSSKQKERNESEREREGKRTSSEACDPGAI